MRAGILMGVTGATLAVVTMIGMGVPGSDLQWRSASVDGIPVTLTSPPGDAHPTVVLAHGFSGSSALMSSTATALASSGLAVVTFDFTGHGANPHVLPSSPAGGGGQAGDALQDDLRSVIAWTLEQPEVDASRLALAGHSMGAGAVVRQAIDGSPASAVIALSLPSAVDMPVGEPTVPPNLLLLVGALEPEGFRMAAVDGLHAAYPNASLGVLEGDFAAGSARMAEVVPSAEHIGIVFSPFADTSMVGWLSDAWGVSLAEPVQPRTPLWLVVSLAAAVLLVGAAGAITLRPGRAFAGLRGSRVLALALGASVTASLISALMSSIAASVVPVAIAGYIAVWFAAAGLATMAMLRVRGVRVLPRIRTRDAIAALALATLATLLIAVPGRWLWAEFSLTGSRWWVLVPLLVCLTIWCWADELLVRRWSMSRRLSLAFGTRAVAIAVLLASVPLLGAPGFLILLLPLMALLLVVLAAMAATVGRREGGFLAAVLVQAVPLAVLVATTFPLVTPA